MLLCSNFNESRIPESGVLSRDLHIIPQIANYRWEFFTNFYTDCEVIQNKQVNIRGQHPTGFKNGNLTDLTCASNWGMLRWIMHCDINREIVKKCIFINAWLWYKIKIESRHGCRTIDYAAFDTSKIREILMKISQYGVLRNKIAQC